MCWVEKSIYLWQREREAVCEPSKTKKLKVKTGASSRSQKNLSMVDSFCRGSCRTSATCSRWSVWLWKSSGSGLINRMTFRGGEMWGHVKAWKAKKILLHHEYIRTTRQCLRAEVDLSQSEEADSTKTRLTALRWRWSVRFYRTDWDYLRHTLQHKCPQKDRSTTSVQMHYMYISENICSSH